MIRYLDEMEETIMTEFRPVLVFVKPHFLKGTVDYNIPGFFQNEDIFFENLAEEIRNPLIPADTRFPPYPYLIREFSTDDLVSIKNIFNLKKVPAVFLYFQNELQFSKKNITRRH